MVFQVGELLLVAVLILLTFLILRLTCKEMAIVKTNLFSNPVIPYNQMLYVQMTIPYNQMLYVQMTIPYNQMLYVQMTIPYNQMLYVLPSIARLSAILILLVQ